MINIASKFKSKITQKGQITIPQEYREKFKLLPGEEVFFYEEDGRIFIISATRFLNDLTRDMKGVSQLQQETREGFLDSDSHD